MQKSILPISYSQIRGEEAGGSVIIRIQSEKNKAQQLYSQIREEAGGSIIKWIQSERNQEAIIFRACPPTPHPPPSIFLWKIDYLPVLGLRAWLLHMFDANLRLWRSMGLNRIRLHSIPYMTDYTPGRLFIFDPAFI